MSPGDLWFLSVLGDLLKGAGLLLVGVGAVMFALGASRHWERRP